MKPFSQWLTDITEELRTADREPEPATHKTSAMDYNAIHQPLISAIKSVAWRASNNLPMEHRIHAKINKLIVQNSKIRDALHREINAGLRSHTAIDEYDQKVTTWVNELSHVGRTYSAGDVPMLNMKDHYKVWKIEGI